VTAKNTVHFHCHAKKLEAICPMHSSEHGESYAAMDAESVSLCKLPEELGREVLYSRLRFQETPRDIISFKVGSHRFVVVSLFVETVDSLKYVIKVFYGYTFTEIATIDNFTENEVVLSIAYVNFRRKL
jgi:hypothetical protein